MSINNLIHDSFQITEFDTSDWSFNESADDEIVDGKYILGRVVGPCFLPNSTSLNNRFYSRQLWENAITNNKDRISNGEMLGTIGHEQPLDDQALSEGKASHKISKLWIDDKTGVGMGEMLILGTPAGHNLNQYLRAKVRLKISSRANGNIVGRNQAGANILDENTYKLFGFDFVQNPGIPTAIPQLVESLNTDIHSENNPMTDTTNDRVHEEKGRLSERLEVAGQKITALSESLTAKDEIIKIRDTEVTNLKTTAAESHAKVSELSTKLDEASTELAKYHELGTYESVSKAINESAQLINEYSALGTPDQLAKVLDKFEVLVEDFQELGKIEDIRTALELVESYQSLGTLDSIKGSIDAAESYKSRIASLEELDKVLAVMESYVDLGTPDEISAVFNATGKMLENASAKKHEQEVSKLMESYSITEEAAKKIYNKMNGDFDSCVEMLESVKPAKADVVSDRYKKSVNESVKVVEQEKTDESVKERSSLSSRLMSMAAQ